MEIKITRYGKEITLKEAIKIINESKLRNLNDKTLHRRKQRLNTRHRA